MNQLYTPNPRSVIACDVEMRYSTPPQLCLNLCLLDWVQVSEPSKAVENGSKNPWVNSSLVLNKILGWIQDPCFNRTSYLSWGRTELSCIQQSCSHAFTAHMAPPRMIVPGVVWTFQSRWDRSESWVHAHWFARKETPSPYRFPNIGLIKHNNPQLALTFFSSFSGPWQQLGTRPLERVWSAHLLTYWESVASWQFVSTKQNKLQLVDKLLDFIC